MLKQSFSALFDRDLGRLVQQIEAYPDEETLWLIDNGIANSPGNLCLHLIGNLNEYIIRRLGNFEYTRDRPAEFNTRFVPKTDLVADLQETRKKLADTFDLLGDDVLDNMYPEEVLGYPMTIHYFLVHLAGHLNYHLGQIDYHRRLLAGGSAIKYNVVYSAK